jgi:outer membrane murein-binding lipoprotein Lpp
MPDISDFIPKSLRTVVFALAAAGAIVTGAVSTLGLIETKSAQAASNAVAPLQVQVNQANQKADQSLAEQALIWEKLGGKIDQLGDKIETLSNTVAGLAQKEADQSDHSSKRR